MPFSSGIILCSHFFLWRLPQAIKINQLFELDYLICGWSFTHFDIIYYICEQSCISPDNLKWGWTIRLSFTFRKKGFNNYFKYVSYTYRWKDIPLVLLPRPRLMQPTTQQEFTTFINLILAVCFPFCPDRKLGPVCHQIDAHVPMDMKNKNVLSPCGKWRRSSSGFTWKRHGSY